MSASIQSSHAVRFPREFQSWDTCPLFHHATLALELGCCLPPHVSSAAIVPAKARTYRKRGSDVSEMDSVSSTYRLPRGQPWMTLRSDTLAGRRVLEARWRERGGREERTLESGASSFSRTRRELVASTVAPLNCFLCFHRSIIGREQTTASLCFWCAQISDLHVVECLKNVPWCP